MGATWSDSPHLSQEAQDRLWASIPVYQRDARTKGIPQLGAGAIWPFPESEIKIPALEIKRFWRRLHAIDAQPLWKTSVTGAYDPDTGIVYITHVWKREQVEPAVHVQALKAIGDWIPAVGDCSGLVQDADRRQYLDIYRACGLEISLAKKGVESGIQIVYDLMAAGQFKVFDTCEKWFDEFRSYRRKPGGQIIKQNDHALDATRYLCVDLEKAIVQPKPEEPEPTIILEGPAREFGWMMS